MVKRGKRSESGRRERDARAKTARASRPSIDLPLRRSDGRPLKAEDRLTVFWMLTTLFTLALLALGAAALVYLPLSGASANGGARAVVDYARFSSAITGILLLILTPIVLRVRATPPPRAVTAFVVLVAAASLTWAMLGPGGGSMAPAANPAIGP